MWLAICSCAQVDSLPVCTTEKYTLVPHHTHTHRHTTRCISCTGGGASMGTQKAIHPGFLSSLLSAWSDGPFHIGCLHHPATPDTHDTAHTISTLSLPAPPPPPDPIHVFLSPIPSSLSLSFSPSLAPLSLVPLCKVGHLLQSQEYTAGERER